MIGHVRMIGSKICGCEKAIEIRALQLELGDQYDGPLECGHAVGSAERPIVSDELHKNLVMDGSFTGLDLIIQWIIGQMATGQGAAAYQNGLNYGEIGTGNTAATLADTALVAAVARTVPTLQQDFGLTQAIVQFFFSDSNLTNTTYNEFATWVNGTASLGSGKIFNRVVFATPYVKVGGQDTTVQVVFTMGQ